MSDILNRMSITKLTEIQEEKALPIDDLRHCPPGLRILDKPTTRSSRPTFQPDENTPKFKAKKAFAFVNGKQVFPVAHEVSKLSHMLGMPIGTINAAIKRNGKTLNGYSFKVEVNEP